MYLLYCIITQDVQVFKYYRDLINFRNRGDPSMMLRCINPVEGKLLDCAAGVHIKFRLAGVRWGMTTGISTVKIDLST